MSRQIQAVRGIRPGGRSARVRAAVLAAAIDELMDTGYAELTMEAVAARAEVNKTTIYRRWPDRDSLLVEALSEWSDTTVAAPDTGTIETDLGVLTDSIVDLLNSPIGRAVLAMVLAARGRNAELLEVLARFFEDREEIAAPLVERAVSRGELPASTDPAGLLATVRAPLFYRIITTGGQLTQRHAREAVELALAAARAGSLIAPDS
ncbi:TetR/AcrR family transcriptional regulator [Mycobacterium sp. 21AC1]|uniref:TetR/AcrR family transcriptional regulator n=1 Tax=[Mycobacterium] appelbergii TaxID=2939269 RepID=UPI002938E4A8|nr:TetR/AcrR family transcriptional regulator [Mycobacterium sp. 21AC1]MDV3128607.1 TetR/AcrR family transcriptional regulator [Mycobacterium sp. 21AC1]